LPLSAAYLGVILIWTTTPLAIQWSGQEVGFLFGVAGRMLLGAFAALAACRILGLEMRWERRALRAYLAAGLGIFTAMLAVYWAAQQIHSGWIAVVFGSSPLVTALMARLWFGGRPLSLHRLAGMGAGLAGLALVFGGGLQLETSAALGVLAVLLAVASHSLSALWVQRIAAPVPALVLTSGGLLVAAPLFLLAWLLFGGGWPGRIPPSAGGAILYLALFGSVIGFALYFQVLQRMEATKVALLTLVTPVSALALGHLANNEPVDAPILLGTGFIVAGLALFQLGDRWRG
jgi:drug/metabolite transporter (DMT)-like permease